ncbi:WD repeat-containing protein 47 isoform X2 [Daktulosphaira vitifoliae]|uniref:WD repeat-containing protein 47 isoform X2 n=1 Tax=Daktulosphaira vitifoliae TaxID=58002 RepID=UPI0021AAFAC3|nr:WD repeat-containing protein 47 isoform X2 [Daktulosphaira vitifoliae]
MPTAKISVREEDIIRLTLEFLYNRELHISQLSVERETGVINGSYSDDALFLRQLILDGQWDDVLEFIQPLEAIPHFPTDKFRYCILRHKYAELICMKSEASVIGSVDTAVEEVVKVLNELEKVCPTKEEYSNLCLMLTLPRLSDNLGYKDWNPSTARVQCFQQVFPLVMKFLPCDKKPVIPDSTNDRLIQLIIKGILYESCCNFCKSKAVGNKQPFSLNILNFSHIFNSSNSYKDTDLSLMSWLQSIPAETFVVPFEQKTLNVELEQLERPSLETSWTEHMLVTPIKPKQFPHSAMPFTRPRSAADIMSRSLLPNLDQTTSSSLISSVGVSNISSNLVKSSFASFHLTGLKSNSAMTSSVDKLFESEMFANNINSDLPSITEVVTPVKENKKNSLELSSPEPSRSSNSTTASNTTRSSRLDSLNDRYQQLSINQSNLSFDAQNSQGDLYKEYQKQKQRYHDALQDQEKERFELIQQLRNTESKLQEENKALPNKTLLRDTDTFMKPNTIQQTVPIKVNVLNGNEKFQQPTANKTTNNGDVTDSYNNDQSGKPKFIAVTRLEDVQAVRCAEFHPHGSIYAVGSNSKTLRICAYPKVTDIRENHVVQQPTVLFKRTRHHKGSIYCMSWTPDGSLIATGSNDKTVKLMRFNAETSNLEGQEIELTMHDGTVRDVCFIEDTINRSSLLISGGAGDCKIYVTDCETGQPYQSLSGHSGHILSLYNWGGAMFVSGSHDRTIRFWDLRTRGCVNVVTPNTSAASRGSPVAAVCVEPSGRLLVTGHEDSACVLYDIRGSRSLQCFKPHSADVRSLRFSPSAYYLLTGGYDNKLVLTDLQGDLTTSLPSVVVAQHQDKVISGRWHPTDFSFLSTSADKTTTLWALPPYK